MIRLIYYFGESIKNCFAFLSFIGWNHAYLVKKSMTHNKYLTFSLCLDNDSISAKTAPQI